MEAAPRIELGLKDLQSSALPLGYTAFKIWNAEYFSESLIFRQACKLFASVFSGITDYLGSLSKFFLDGLDYVGRFC